MKNQPKGTWESIKKTDDTWREKECEKEEFFLCFKKKGIVCFRKKKQWKEWLFQKGLRENEKYF